MNGLWFKASPALPNLNEEYVSFTQIALAVERLSWRGGAEKFCGGRRGPKFAYHLYALWWDSPRCATAVLRKF